MQSERPGELAVLGACPPTAGRTLFTPLHYHIRSDGRSRLQEGALPAAGGVGPHVRTGLPGIRSRHFQKWKSPGAK